MASLASGADRDDVRHAVIDVALMHHLVSQFTSLVAVDVTPSRPAGEGVTPGAVPTPMPAGWTAPGSLPVGGTGWVSQAASGVVLMLLAAALLLVRRRAPAGAAAAAGGGRRRVAG
jgi:Ca-activated chloride channel family protein